MAFSGDIPLACIGWGSAAWAVRSREQFIGWPKRIKDQRLHFIANNTRYLILPWVFVKCLASKIMALNIKRIASDWHQMYQYPLYMLETFVEPDLKLELPVAACNIAGNGEEGKKILTNTQQIKAHHACCSKVDIADAKYDTIENYTRLRKNGSVPIIDCNKRNENLTSEALWKRGYDRNGWPFAPCGIPAKPNGFDRKHQRHTFCCFKQCLNLKVTGIKNIQKDYDIGACPHIKREKGYSKHTYIKDNPRPANEIPRGTKRFKLIQQYRSASERVNSIIKEDLNICIKHPLP